MNLPKKTTLSEKMYETTIEEDMHFLTEVVDGLTEDDVNEIMTNASELGISARYYLEEFTFW
jgi:formylmethanofuran:tetrahydromethanopterin formyltransferase